MFGADLVLGHRVDAAARRAAPSRSRGRRRPGCRSRSTDAIELRPHRRDAPVLGERRRDRRAALGLAAVEPRLRAARSRPSRSNCWKPCQTFVNIAPEAIGSDDRVGRLPAELLDDLERERLRALGVVGAQVDVDDPPLDLARELADEARAVVVAAAHAVDASRRRPSSPANFSGSSPAGQKITARHARVAAARAATAFARLPVEVAESVSSPNSLRLRGGDRDDAVLERVRRVREVELEQDLADAERATRAAAPGRAACSPGRSRRPPAARPAAARRSARATRGPASIRSRVDDAPRSRPSRRPARAARSSGRRSRSRRPDSRSRRRGSGERQPAWQLSLD